MFFTPALNVWAETHHLNHPKYFLAANPCSSMGKSQNMEYFLIDNGSLRPGSILQIEIAARLSEVSDILSALSD